MVIERRAFTGFKTEAVGFRNWRISTLRTPPTVIQLHEAAYAQLHCQKALEVIPGATHLFEEPGALAHVARLAAGLFQQYLHPARLSEEQQQALLEA